MKTDLSKDKNREERN